MLNIDVMDRVVVGVDGSPMSQTALRWAAEWARSQRRPLTVLGATPPILTNPGHLLAATMSDAAIHHTRENVERLVEGLRQDHPDLQVEAMCVDETPARALIEASTQADLVVLGTRAHDGVFGRLLGSTVDQVAAHAAGPVVVVPEAPEPATEAPIVVGLDSSANAGRALRFALSVAHRTGRPLAALRAWTVDYAWTAAPIGLENAEILTLLDAEHRALEAALAGAREDFPAVEVTSRIERGNAGQLLAEASADAWMVVVGTRGRGGFTGLLLGSTSRRVLHGARCPVAVIR